MPKERLPTAAAFIKDSPQSNNPSKCVFCPSREWKRRVRASCCWGDAACTPCVKKALERDQKCPYCKKVVVCKPRGKGNAKGDAASARKSQKGPAPSSSASGGPSPTLPLTADPHTSAADRQAARRDNSPKERRTARAATSSGTPGASSGVIDHSSPPPTQPGIAQDTPVAQPTGKDPGMMATITPMSLPKEVNDSLPLGPAYSNPAMMAAIMAMPLWGNDNAAPVAPSPAINHTAQPDTARAIDSTPSPDTTRTNDLPPSSPFSSVATVGSPPSTPPTSPSIAAATVGDDIDWTDDSAWTPTEQLVTHLRNYGVAAEDLGGAFDLKKAVRELESYDFQLFGDNDGEPFNRAESWHRRARYVGDLGPCA
ncbi:hypothetical protein MBLNU457_4858t1 [Dothideomycetes sp. NU457]